MHHPTERVSHTMTFVIPVVEYWLEREIAQWVHHEGSIVPSRSNIMKVESPVWYMCDICFNKTCLKSEPCARKSPS